MVVVFFYLLKSHGIPVSPIALLRLHKAMHTGVISSIDDFYTGARTILVKNEKYFDLYDQLFAYYFEGVELSDPKENELLEVAQAMLEEWLRDPVSMAAALGVRPDMLAPLSPDELVTAGIIRGECGLAGSR